MKTKTLAPLVTVLAVAVGLCLLAGCASQATKNKIKSPDQVPAAVKQTFQAKFPAVRQAEWKLKSDQNYEAEFTLEQTEIAAKFDPSGQWLETETAIPTDKVPQPVLDTISRQFKDFKIIETQNVERPGGLPLIYELHLDNGKVIVKAQFSANGDILNQASKPKR